MDRNSELLNQLDEVKRERTAIFSQLSFQSVEMTEIEFLSDIC